MARAPKASSGHTVSGRWILAPINDITTPREGRICYLGRWWAVTRNHQVLFFDSYTSPQCHHHAQFVGRLGRGFDAPELLAPMFIPVAYVPHNCSDYL